MTSAFECPKNGDQRALEHLSDALVECIHCGLCLEACPTYVELGREEDSPRGRIYLMRAVAEGGHIIDHSVVDHLDVCLGCLACETACPSGVKYGYLLEHARARIEQDSKRPFKIRLGRKLVLAFLTRPVLLGLGVFLATLPARFLKKIPRLPGSVLSRVIGATDYGADLYLARFSTILPQHLPTFTRSKGETKKKVALLEGCVMPVLFPEINKATVNVLSSLGCEVYVPAGQTCCGALHVHNGLKTTAARMALHNIDVFEKSGGDYIVVNSAGCGSTMKHYADLFDPGSDEHRRAIEFSSKVRDVSEIITELLEPDSFCKMDVSVAYHDACHLAHGQKIRSQPRAMLSAIPGLKLLTIPESEHCCGSAGVYSFTQPDLARSLQSRKINNIEVTNADIVATGNPGCLMWIRSGLLERGSQIKAVHPVELLEMALNCSEK